MSVNVQGSSKLIKIAGSGGKVDVDDALSTTSENPVQNKIITADVQTRTTFNDAGYVSGTTYAKNTMLKHNGYVWIAITETSTEPSSSNTDWMIMAQVEGASISNSTAITTEGSYALDAIQNNASVTGTLAKRLSDLETSSGGGTDMSQYYLYHSTNASAEEIVKQNVDVSNLYGGYHLNIGGYTYAKTIYYCFHMTTTCYNFRINCKYPKNNAELEFYHYFQNTTHQLNIMTADSALQTFLTNNPWHIYYGANIVNDIYLYVPINNSSLDGIIASISPYDSDKGAETSISEISTKLSLPTDLTEWTITYNYA